MYNSSEIGAAWDKNLESRIQDIESGNDVVYLNTVVPNVLEEVCKYPSDSVILDIGCLYGHLTNKIAKTHPNITGIDVAEKAIKYGIKKYPDIQLIHADVFSLETICEYDLCLATMVIHNLEPLSDFLKKAYILLNDKGRLLLMTLHPVVWARERIENFDYRRETQYDVPFRTRSGYYYPSPLIYFHRTLETYFREICSNGFSVVDFKELYKRNEKMPHNLFLSLQKGYCKDSIGIDEMTRKVKNIN